MNPKLATAGSGENPEAEGERLARAQVVRRVPFRRNIAIGA